MRQGIRCGQNGKAGGAQDTSQFAEESLRIVEMLNDLKGAGQIHARVPHAQLHAIHTGKRQSPPLRVASRCLSDGRFVINAEHAPTVLCQMIGSIAGSTADIEYGAVPQKSLCGLVGGEQLQIERVV